MEDEVGRLAIASRRLKPKGRINLSGNLTSLYAPSRVAVHPLLKR